MSVLTTHAVSHRRLKAFVKWIVPEQDTKQKIRDKAKEIKAELVERAENDGLIVEQTTNSGSFEKESGLRRYMRGYSVEEGQDVDIAIILKPKDSKGNLLGEQVTRFRDYLKDIYTSDEVGETKSSATIVFSSSKFKFDIVPMFTTSKAGHQLLKRTNGDERKTSITKHTQFVLQRKDESDAIYGVVKFNDCLRLIKWWRTVQQENSGVFGNSKRDKKVPSFLLDLLCAHAYDKHSVSETYPETLAQWFGTLANVVKTRKDVYFDSFPETSTNGARWRVIDPIDGTNNVVGSWGEASINELARLFEVARDEMHKVIRFSEEGDDVSAMDSMVKLFGNAFKNNCE